MNFPRIVVIASNNEKKAREIQKILESVAFSTRVLNLQDVGLRSFEIEETGTTFEDNARIKCLAVKKALQSTSFASAAVLADDSGLCIDVLNGRPGVRSARFSSDAGLASGDGANIQYALKLLEGIPEEKRSAYFCCVLAWASGPTESLKIFSGILRGNILAFPQGDLGFGYDPIFRPLQENRTLAMMSAEEKNKISHRSQAIRMLAASMK